MAENKTALRFVLGLALAGALVWVARLALCGVQEGTLGTGTIPPAASPPAPPPRAPEPLPPPIPSMPPSAPPAEQAQPEAPPPDRRAALRREIERLDEAIGETQRRIETATQAGDPAAARGAQAELKRLEERRRQKRAELEAPGAE